jgi:predicted hotdog family 3-hydroxylacyl-ACP dehydratase
MGVNVGTLPVSAFIALIAAAVLVIVGVIARRRGHLRSRAGVIAIAIIIALLVIFGMTGGFLPWM